MVTGRPLRTQRLLSEPDEQGGGSDRSPPPPPSSRPSSQPAYADGTDASAAAQWPARASPPRPVPAPACVCRRMGVRGRFPVSLEPSQSPECPRSAFAGDGPTKVLRRLCAVSLSLLRGPSEKRLTDAGFLPAPRNGCRHGAERQRCSRYRNGGFFPRRSFPVALIWHLVQT